MSDINVELVRDEMLEGRGMDAAFDHACLIIANMRKHLEASEQNRLELQAENHRLRFERRI